MDQPVLFPKRRVGNHSVLSTLPDWAVQVLRRHQQSPQSTVVLKHLVRRVGRYQDRDTFPVVSTLDTRHWVLPYPSGLVQPHGNFGVSGRSRRPVDPRPLGLLVRSDVRPPTVHLRRPQRPSAPRTVYHKLGVPGRTTRRVRSSTRANPVGVAEPVWTVYPLRSRKGPPKDQGTFDRPSSKSVVPSGLEPHRHPLPPLTSLRPPCPL